MKRAKKAFAGALIAGAALIAVNPVLAADKPNILVIWGDDVGMYNISAYHKGMMGGKPRISTESPMRVRSWLTLQTLLPDHGEPFIVFE